MMAYKPVTIFNNSTGDEISKSGWYAHDSVLAPL